MRFAVLPQIIQVFFLKFEIAVSPVFNVEFNFVSCVTVESNQISNVGFKGFKLALNPQLKSCQEEEVACS